jgi:hypothetical protein
LAKSGSLTFRGLKRQHEPKEAASPNHNGVPAKGTVSISIAIRLSSIPKFRVPQQEVFMRTISSFALIVVMCFGQGFAADAPNSAGQPGSADALMQQITELRAELDQVRQERDALQRRLEQLQSMSAKQAEQSQLAPLGAVWKGTLQGRGQSGRQGAKMKVVAREGKKLTLLMQCENGASGEFECELVNDRDIKITANRLISANRGNDDPRPVGGTKGSGRVADKKLSLHFALMEARGETLEWHFVGDLVESSDE